MESDSIRKNNYSNNFITIGKSFLPLPAYIVSLMGWGLLLTVPYLLVRLLARTASALLRRCCYSPDILADKVVLVTGASSGIGEAVARALYPRGCHLVLAARSVDKLNSLKHSLVNQYSTPVFYEPIVLPLDLSLSPSTVAAAIKPLLARLGHVDVLINNAGQSYRGEAATTSLDVDERLLRVNYLGHVAVTKAVLPEMIRRRQGHIVSVGSVQDRLAIPFRSCYTAAKHALRGFMDCLRAEVSRHGITVSLVSPGYVNTGLSRHALTAQGGVYGVMDATTAAGMKPEAVAAEIVLVLERGTEDLLLCSWLHRVAVALTWWAPELLRYTMKFRARRGQEGAGEQSSAGEQGVVEQDGAVTHEPKSGVEKKEQ